MAETKKNNNKYWLVRQISDKTGFTILDVTTVLDAFEKTIQEVIANRMEFAYPRMFRIKIKKVKERKGYDANRKQFEIFPEAEKIVFSVSRYLKNIIKESQDDDYNEDEEFD